LVAWNVLVYLGLGLFVLLKNRNRIPARLPERYRRPARQEHQGEPIKTGSRVTSKVPWMARHLLPDIWRFVHKVMFGFHQTKNLADLTRQFTGHWFSIAGPLVAARWKYLLHLGALCLAVGATLGMYFRGLFQGYKFVWASAFVTEEKTVSTFIHIVFGPSLFISNLLSLGLSERVDIARRLTPQGDTTDEWIHLFAITVVIIVVIPRSLLALAQCRKIKTQVNRLGLALDDYYGEVIEKPIRAIVAKEVETAVRRFSETVATSVGGKLYAEQIVP